MMQKKQIFWSFVDRLKMVVKLWMFNTAVCGKIVPYVPLNESLKNLTEALPLVKKSQLFE